MAKYSEIDPKFLRRYFDLLANHGREVDNKYSNHNCGKEVFIRRTMAKWLKDKCFVVIQKDTTGTYASSNPTDATGTGTNPSDGVPNGEGGANSAEGMSGRA